MPIGGFSGDTFSDLIERTYRRLMSGMEETVVQLAADYSPDSGQITLKGTGINTISANSRLAIEEEVYRITGWVPTGQTGGGAQIAVTDGSSDSIHLNGTSVFVNPRYTRFDIGVAINDALNALSSPTNGLFQVGTTTITYNPAFMGYDLGPVPKNFTRILELTYAIPGPSKNFPRIARYRVLRGVTNDQFPSGQGIILYRPAYPGFNINVAYGYPFTNLHNLDDEVTLTSGIPVTAIDIPSLMAEVYLTESREIKRNFIESQPDAKILENVLAGGMMNSINPLLRRIEQRISEEADRLDAIWPRQRALV